MGRCKINGWRECAKTSRSGPRCPLLFVTHGADARRPDHARSARFRRLWTVRDLRADDSTTAGARSSRAFIRCPRARPCAGRSTRRSASTTELADDITPWAPAYYGSLRVEGWHAMLIESVPGDTHAAVDGVAGATRGALVRRVPRRTVDAELPEWLAARPAPRVRWASGRRSLPTTKHLARLSAPVPNPDHSDATRRLDREPTSKR